MCVGSLAAKPVHQLETGDIATITSPALNEISSFLAASQSYNALQILGCTFVTQFIGIHPTLPGCL